jgi:hypothetical protein
MPPCLILELIILLSLPYSSSFVIADALSAIAQSERISIERSFLSESFI